MPIETNPLVSYRLLVVLGFALLLAAYTAIFGKYFPIDGYVMGHDYSLALPGLLDGYFWFRNNGISPPWFSPSFCAGQPLFTDPQSAYYSLMQWFSFYVDPVTACYWTLLLSASMMFWGAYLLMRYAFQANYSSAVLVGGLMMFNGFLPYRMVVGHLGFHGLALVPWIALLLMVSLKKRFDSLVAGMVTGLLLAYWTQSGMGSIMIPASLGIFLIVLMRGMRGDGFLEFFIRSGIAVLVGLCLSASKLVAGSALLKNFSRDFYALPGAQSVWDSLVMTFAAMFLSGQHVFEIMMPRMANMQWALMPHEWAFGFTLAPLIGLLLLICGVPWPILRQANRRNALIVTVMLLCLFLPVVFNIYDPAWNAFLKSLPILGSASTLTRWLILYVPFFAVLVGLMMHLNRWSENIKAAITGVTLIGTVVLTAIEPQDYFLNQDYDVKPVLIANAQVRTGKLEPQIVALGQQATVKIAGMEKQLLQNDTFLAGVSKVFCYNPIFGYRLEKFSAAGLVSGDVLQVRDGFLNLKNPACYVFPVENGCQPGDRFRADQIEEARAFVAYRPFHFAVSEKQALANLITAWSGWLVVILLAAWLILLLSRRKDDQSAG